MAPMLSQLIDIGSSALGTTPSSVMNSFIHIASCEASEAAMYSDSGQDLATTLCFALLHLTAAPPKTNTYPECDLESSGSVFQLASVQPWNGRCSSPPPFSS